MDISLKSAGKLDAAPAGGRIAGVDDSVAGLEARKDERFGVRLEEDGGVRGQEVGGGQADEGQGDG